MTCTHVATCIHAASENRTRMFTNTCGQLFFVRSHCLHRAHVHAPSVSHQGFSARVLHQSDCFRPAQHHRCSAGTEGGLELPVCTALLKCLQFAVSAAPSTNCSASLLHWRAEQLPASCVPALFAQGHSDMGNLCAKTIQK